MAKAKKPATSPKAAKKAPTKAAKKSAKKAPAGTTAKPASKTTAKSPAKKAAKKVVKAPPKKVAKSTAKAAADKKPASTAKKTVKKASKAPAKPAAKAKPAQTKPAKSHASGLSFLQGKPGSNAAARETIEEKPRLTKTKLGVRDLRHFRDLLLTKRRQLQGDMTSMEKEALQSEGSNLSHLPVHMADMGTDNYEQEFTLTLVDRDRKIVEEIDHALEKIEDKTYGICEGTGQMIGRERLEAQPWARYSIEYARQQQQQRRY